MDAYCSRADILHMEEVTEKGDLSALQHGI